MKNSKSKKKGDHPFDPTTKELEIAARMIKQSMIEQEKPGFRSLDDERVFMEDLLVKRLYTLMLVFSLLLELQRNLLAYQ